jgi:hypothetical protein
VGVRYEPRILESFDPVSQDKTGFYPATNHKQQSKSQSGKNRSLGEARFLSAEPTKSRSGARTPFPATELSSRKRSQPWQLRRRRAAKTRAQTGTREQGFNGKTTANGGDLAQTGTTKTARSCDEFVGQLPYQHAQLRAGDL